MIDTKIGEIAGKTLTYHQCTTLEEQGKVPSGLSGYWEYDGRKIYAPGEIVNLTVAHAASGQLQINALTDPKVLSNHYDRLRKHQQDLVNTHYTKMIEDYRNNPNIPDNIKSQAIKQMEHTKQFFCAPEMYPDQMGVFTPSREQAEYLMGKDVLDSIPVEQQKRMFGES